MRQLQHYHNALYALTVTNGTMSIPSTSIGRPQTPETMRRQLSSESIEEFDQGRARIPVAEAGIGDRPSRAD